MLSRQFSRQAPRVLRRTPTARFAQQSRFSSTQSQSKQWSTPAVIGAVGISAGGFLFYQLAWRKDPRDAAKPVASSLAESNEDVPDLNQLGLSQEISYTPPPSSEDVTRQLNELAFSFEKTKAPGVGRYDGAQLASNSPCEDAWLHGSFSSPFGQEDWMAWAVFDGHCGWQLSNHLTKQLMPYVRQSLSDVRPKNGSEVSEQAVHEALKSAFMSLDEKLVKTAKDTIESDLSFPEKARRLELGYAGACALLTLFDPTTRKLRIASTGDCRAVLGTKNADGKWETAQLTVDQTGANQDEIARIQAQFPDEPDICKGGRIWGMQPSRTFGDGMWKWTSELKKNLRLHFNGLSLPSGVRYQAYKNGPYLTAEPMVTTTTLPETQPSFLILATDGLWDTMSSEQAVELVGRWIDWQSKGKQPAPVKADPAGFGPTILGIKQDCQYDEKRATLQDGNAAVHLMRNGLGGAHDEMVRGALTFRYPNSRDIRDDMTIQVVFFNPRK